MPTRSPPTPTQALPKMQPPAPTHQLNLLFSPSVPQTPPPTPCSQSATDHDDDAISAMPQGAGAEDEYTISAYGDISLGDVIVPPSPSPTPPSSSFGPLQPILAQPRLRLKVRRPPMPKRRPSYIYVPDPPTHIEGMDPDERWPGSPRPFVDSWLQHQPLASVVHTTSWTRGNQEARNGGSSLEKLLDELIRSPSIRLSPPGSPPSQALQLPQEARKETSGGQQARNVPRADDAAKLPRQDKPKEAPRRTRLPPRPPIPKWDT